MFEARLEQGALLKKLLDAVKELVTDANFDCSATGFGLQAMDSSHVSLVSMMVRERKKRGDFAVLSLVFLAFIFARVQRARRRECIGARKGGIGVRRGGVADANRERMLDDDDALPTKRNESNRARRRRFFFFFFADGKLFGARFRAVVCFDRSCSFALAHDREPLSPSPRRRGGMKGRKLRCERAPLTISFFLSLRAIEKSSVSPPLSTSHPRFLFFPLLFSTAPLRRLRALPLRPQPLDGHQPQQHGQDA